MPLSPRLLALALLPGCTLYVGGEEVDDVADAAILGWDFDAQRPPDAYPGDETCAIPLPCPSASANKVTVCGRLRDLATDALVVSDPPAGWTLCDPSAPTEAGSCHLRLRFYDALDFAGNPTGAAPLGFENLRLDACGRFIAENITRPSLGFLAIAVDDAAGTPDDHRTAAVAFPVTSGQSLLGTAAYALRSADDEAWTSQAGLGATTFADRGAILALFTSNGAPAPGVVATPSAYYFSDTDPTMRTTVDPMMTATGPDGAALLLDPGVGACSMLVAGVPGVVWVEPMAPPCP